MADSEQERPRRRWLFRFLGPAQLGEELQGNPLLGTKYDPAVKRARREAAKAERARRRAGGGPAA